MEPLKRFAPFVRNVGLAFLWCASAAPIYANDVPAGFEDLVDHSGIEGDLILDVKVQALSLGQFDTYIDANSVRFKQPSRLLAKLPFKLKAASVIQLTETLKQPIPFYDELCNSQTLPHCPQPDWLLRIRPNLDFFELSVQVNPDHYAVGEKGETSLLNSTAEDLAVVATLFGVASQNDNESTQYSLSPTVIASKGSVRAKLSGSLTQDSRFETDEAYIGQDIHRFRYRLGYIQPNSRSLITNGKVVGAAFGSQIDTRADKEKAVSSKLFVSLAEESAVEIFDGDRLLDVQRHRPGLVELNTQHLPVGSYTVRIRISPILGGPSVEETQFFSKDSSIPPAGETQLQIIAGKDEASGEGIAVFDAGRRLGDHIVARSSVSATETERGGEIALDFLYDNFRAGVSTSALSNQSLGYRGYFNTSWDYTTLNAEYTVFPLADNPDPSATKRTVKLNNYWRLGRNSSLNLRYQNRALVSGVQNDFGATFNTTLWRQHRSHLTGSLEYNNADDDDYVGVLLSWGTSIAGTQFGLSGTQRNFSGTAEDESNLRSYVGHRWDNGKSTTLVDYENHLQNNLTSHNVGVDYSGQRLVGAINASVTEQDNNERRHFYSASFGSSLYATKGNLGLAKPSSESGVYVVDIQGGTGDEAFDVIVGSQRVTTAYSQSKTAISLAPYQQIRVSVSAQDSSAMHFDRTPRNVVLFPGNVQVGQWEVKRITTIFGRLVNPSGQAIARAEIKGGIDPTYTDEYGYYQMQAADELTALSVVSLDGGLCSVSLPELDRTENFHALDDLSCDLPATETANIETANGCQVKPELQPIRFAYLVTEAPIQKEPLEKAAVALNDYIASCHNAKFTLVGSADIGPKGPDNAHRFARARAQMVKAALVSAGVPSKALDINTQIFAVENLSAGKQYRKVEFR